VAVEAEARLANPPNKKATATNGMLNQGLPGKLEPSSGLVPWTGVTMFLYTILLPKNESLQPGQRVYQSYGVQIIITTSCFQQGRS
jgi:hypothetical protein